MTDPGTITTWVAIYAACVSTGALFIQFWGWMTSGPRLRLSLISDGVVVGGNPEYDERDLVIVTATNVGTSATMIINLGIEERYPFYYFWRREAINAYVIPNPQLKGYPHNIPQLLEPARQWMGVIRSRPDVIPQLRNGDHYALVQTSYRRRPYRKRIAPIKPQK